MKTNNSKKPIEDDRSYTKGTYTYFPVDKNYTDASSYNPPPDYIGRPTKPTPAPPPKKKE